MPERKRFFSIEVFPKRCVPISHFWINHLQSSLWVTSWLTLHYLATLARKIRSVLNFRLLLSSRCIFDNKLTPSFLDFLSNGILFRTFVENYHISIFTTFAKQSMINRLSNPINRNRSAAKISKVMSSTEQPS